MANKTLKMSTIRQIIRLKLENVSGRRITELLGLSHTTVLKYLKSIKDTEIDLKELLDLSDLDLEELFNSSKEKKSPYFHKTLEYFNYVQKELTRKHVTLKLLWDEYHILYPQGYGYQHFCKEFKIWSKKQDVPMHFEHKAGDKLFVDFTGDKMHIVDVETGEIKYVEVFVAILGCSQLTYAEATESQKKEDFIGAVERTLEYLNGVPLCIVPDNLKSAVKKADKYEAVINETFQDFSLHYNTTVMPARARRPRDKALVENAVNLIYQRVFATLRNRIFYSLTELNAAILEKIEAHNNSPFQRKDVTRRQQFEDLEKVALKELPKEKYEFKKYKTITVAPDSHVCLWEDKHYYSVPFRYCREKVKMIYTSTKVEIYHKNVCIAFHKRNYTFHKYSTIPDHVPSTHNYKTEWNAERLLKWAATCGEYVETLIQRILERRSYPEQAYKSCFGVLSYVKKVGKERLNNACRRALEYQSPFYPTVKNILENGLDQAEQESSQFSIPFHQNIRGKEFFK